MRTRLYWSKCTLKRSESEPVDTFWVEATNFEAKQLIFPHCSARQIESSLAYALRDHELSYLFSNPALAYCFLVAQDLSSIEPFAVYYPFSPMWDAYSPFRSIEENQLASLEDLKTIIPIVINTKTQPTKSTLLVSQTHLKIEIDRNLELNCQKMNQLL